MRCHLYKFRWRETRRANTTAQYPKAQGLLRRKLKVRSIEFQFQREGERERERYA